MKNILLNRSEFKESVFERDNNKCVICGENAVDAHHIIDRSLFNDGGYYIDNGVSLCEKHHIEAEQTIISCEELRNLAGIENKIYPENLSFNEFVFDYDKWGNPILKNGKRLKGYKFFQENVQKILKPVMQVFEKDYEMTVNKYPRTYHIPFSKGTTSDDRISKNINNILKNNIVISEKLDGENTSISQFGLYARSRVAPTKNPWAQWLKPMWDSMKRDLGSFDLEICGENMYGEHSIIYSGLDKHFYVFGMRNTKHDIFLSWEETKYYTELFDLELAPVLFEGESNFDMDEFENIVNGYMTEDSVLSDKYWKTPKEGIVARIQNEFHNDMFYNSVFKYVRAKHVKTDKHWSKNWKRAYLKHELENIKDLNKIYEQQISNGLIKL